MTDEAQPVIQHNTSRARQTARRLGIDVTRPGPSLPITEQEQTDTM